MVTTQMLQRFSGNKWKRRTRKNVLFLEPKLYPAKELNYKIYEENKSFVVEVFAENITDKNDLQKTIEEALEKKFFVNEFVRPLEEGELKDRLTRLVSINLTYKNEKIIIPGKIPTKDLTDVIIYRIQKPVTLAFSRFYLVSD